MEMLPYCSEGTLGSSESLSEALAGRAEGAATAARVTLDTVLEGKPCDPFPLSPSQPQGAEQPPLSS